MSKAEDPAVEYALGVAKAVTSKLGLLLIEEYLLLSGVRGEIANQKDEAAVMNAVLRMFSEADDGAVQDHFVREWMKQVRELAYDTEDCIDLFMRRISWVPRGAGCFGRAWRWIVTLGPRHRLATDMQAFRARAQAISERRMRYGLDVQALRPSMTSASRALAMSTPALGLGAGANDPNQFVGIRQQVDDLYNKVSSERKMTDNPGQVDEKLKVFSIVGLGGLGKTTLAVEVCRQLEACFSCQAVVSVSQAFDASKDMDGLKERILRQVTKTGHISSADTLDAYLAEKRYLIVIDDVWTIAAWNAIWQMLPENNNSSRIIVTTRIETVAKACSSYSAVGEYIHHPEPLKEKDSKSLFVKLVFGEGKNSDDELADGMDREGVLADEMDREGKNFPRELEDEMDKILKKCGGLPLAIVNIASVLASYKSPESLEMWERISRSIGSQMKSNPTLEGMMQILTLSYNHLPHHLKTCMLYFSIFPEDYVTRKDRLLNRWIAEGFIPQKRGLTLAEVAESYYNELFSRNMIQPGEVIYDGTARECRVHDMMLEVIVSKSLEVNFVTLVGSGCGGTSYDVVRRLSIQGDLGSGIEKTNMQHVRSLSTFGPKGQGKLLDRLAEFTLLRVLDLQDCQDVKDHHLKHVCQLFLLSFLNLVGTNITLLPTQISQLQHLQTLWLHLTLLSRVPESVINLEKLENLSLSNKTNWRILLRLPQGLSKLKALEGLLRLGISEGDTEVAKEIGDMVQLRRLGIVLSCTDCWDKPVLQNIATSIGKICSLRDLSIEDTSEGANNMDFLQDLPSPPHLLRHITIGGKIRKFPDWLVSLRHLAHIELWWIDMHGADIYSVLHKLPNLLRITFDRNCCKDDELVASTKFKFPALKELAIVRDYGTPKVVRFEEGAMENLEKLTVCFRGQERSLAGLGNLISLKEVELIGSRDITTLQTAKVELQAESQRRGESKQFKIIMNYE